MRTLLLASCLLLGNAHAMDVVWLRLSSRYFYQSQTHTCDVGFVSTQRYFSAEIREGAVVAAGFSEYANPPKFWLKDEELSGVKFTQDSEGRYWLKSLRLNARILNWFTKQFHDCLFCPGVLIENLSVNPTFDFEMEGVAQGVLSSYSPTLIFTGTNEKKENFQIQLRFVQQLYSTSEWKEPTP